VTKKLPNLIKQFAQDFQIPVAVVYLAIFAVVSVAGIFVTTSAIREEQIIRGRATYQVVGCNEPCTHNHQCEPDHFCFQGRCRLADNPESPTCELTPVPSPTTPPVITEPTQPIDKGTETPLPTETEEPEEATDAAILQPTPIEEMEDSTVVAQLEPEPTIVVDEEIEPIAKPDVSESTFFEQILGALNQIFPNTDDVSLPMILGIGLVGLVILLIVVSLANSKKNKYRPTNFKSLELPQQEQQPEPTKPAQPAQTIHSDKVSIPTNKQPATPTPQPKYSDGDSDDLTPPPSTMISRIKEKDIEVPRDD